MNIICKIKLVEFKEARWNEFSWLAYIAKQSPFFGVEDEFSLKGGQDEGVKEVGGQEGC